ncbi:MAG: hypothetical protein L6R41_006392 [Letrouitia leprolyta]|nr:MAG: hypothetical protein L6R41_006392 [Letrouitia leprolyta]
MYTTGLKRPWDAEAAAAHCMSERGSDSESDSNSQSEDREFLNASETCRDEDEEMGEVKEVLTNTLDSVTSIADTEWAFGNQMNRPPNPGLTLSNHGIVGLPLSALEAYRIRQEAILNKGSDKMDLESANNLARYAQDFGDELSTWKRLRENGDAPELLVYVLNDEYSKESLRLDKLTAVDQLKAEYSQERCKRQGARPFLSKMTGCVQRRHGYKGDGDTEMELHDLIGLDGKEVLDGSFSVEPQSIVQGDIYSGRDYNDPDFDPGSELEEECYVDWVFVLVPEECCLELILTNSKDKVIRSWLERLMESLQSDTPTYSARAEAVVHCFLARYLSWGQLPPKDPHIYYQECLGILIRASILSRERVLFSNSVCKDPASITQDVFLDIGKALINVGLSLFKEG